MGYYFSSYEPGAVAIPNSARVTAALHFSALEQTLASDSRLWQLSGLGEELEPIDRVINFIQFEKSYDFDANFELGDSVEGGTLIKGSFDTKYNPAIDFSLRWLSSVGVGFSLSCLGEDGSLWQYESATGLGNYAKRELVPTSVGNAHLIAALQKQVTALSNMKDSADWKNLRAILGEEIVDSLVVESVEESDLLRVKGKIRAKQF